MAKQKLRAEKDVEMVYSALDVSHSIKVLDGSLKQTYYPTNGDYVPNRNIIPTVLIPSFIVKGKDGIIENGEKVSELSGGKWFENDVQIVNNPDYEVGKNYQLTIFKNIEDVTTLRFEGEFLDKRNKKVIAFDNSILLSTIHHNEHKAEPKLELDKPNNWEHFPVKSGDGIVSIKATVTDDKLYHSAVRWFMVKDKVEIPIEETLFYVSGQNTNELKVDTSYMGEVLIRAKNLDYEELFGDEPENLLVGGNIPVKNNKYYMTSYDFSDFIQEDEEITLTLKGKLGEGKSIFTLYNTNAYTIGIGNTKDIGNGFYILTAKWKIGEKENTKAVIYAFPPDTTTESEIEWAVLTRGNTPATQWTPSTKDLAPDGIVKGQYEAEILFMRKLPNNLRIDTTVPSIIPNTLTDFRVQAIISHTGGIIENPDEHFFVEWLKKSTGAGQTEQVVGYTSEIDISLKEGDKVIVQIEQYDEYKASVSSDNKIMTDEQNRIITLR